MSSPSHRLRCIRATRKQSSAPSTKMTWQSTAITTRTRLTTIRFRLIKVFCPRFAPFFSRLEWAVRTYTHPGLPPVVAACSGVCTWLHRICERHVPALDYHSNSLHTSLGLQVRRWAWASRGLPLGMVLAFHRVWLRQAVQATAGEALSRHALPCLMASCRVLLVSIPRAHSRGAAV